MLELSPTEAELSITKDESGACYYSYGGRRYLVAKEDDVKEECRNSLDKYMWIECIEADRTEEGFEGWQNSIIANDGYGSILNRNDGSEHSATIDGEYYFVIES